MICSKHNLKIKLFHQFSICLLNCCSFRSLSRSSNPVCVKMPSKFVVFIGVTPDTVDTCIQTNPDREKGRSPQVVFTPSSLKPILMQKPQALTFPQNRSNSFELFFVSYSVSSYQLLLHVLQLFALIRQLTAPKSRAVLPASFGPHSSLACWLYRSSSSNGETVWVPNLVRAKGFLELNNWFGLRRCGGGGALFTRMCRESWAGTWQWNTVLTLTWLAGKARDTSQSVFWSC